MKAIVYRRQVITTGCCSYSVLVPIDELQEAHKANASYFTIQDGRYHVTLFYAMLPPGFAAMPQGIDRLKVFLAVERKAKALERLIAAEKFAEVNDFPGTDLGLWHPVPDTCLANSQHEVEIDIAPENAVAA